MKGAAGEEARATMSLRPSERAEVRRSRYKVAVDAEEDRRRREDNMVEIRKSRREESPRSSRSPSPPSRSAAVFIPTVSPPRCLMMYHLEPHRLHQVWTDAPPIRSNLEIRSSLSVFSNSGELM